MKARAAVLEAFDQPLAVREYPISPLADQEVLVRIKAAGVCGSDVHMWHGNDPRTPLPIILGHEGIGEVAGVGGTKLDVFGRELKTGDPIVYERGIMCGRCYYCVIKKQPALCPTRKTYGISVGCAEPPHLRGAYAEYIHLLPAAHIIKLDADVDPATLVAATCSGATAAHTNEQAGIHRGDSVLIIGPGPVGIFSLVFARESGAWPIIVMGTEADKLRLDICKEMGADEVITIEGTTLDERVQKVKDMTGGFGANVVLECTGNAKAAESGIKFTAPYGTYAIPGIATPAGELSVAFFEDVARKNVNLQGVWVSDTSHLYAAIKLVLSGRYPFDRLVTHRFPLDKATDALEAIHNREAIKAVLIP